MTKYFDVFNGDADGICALIQLRLAKPLDAELITGVKRDITLLQQVNAIAGDCITVLDISLDRNRTDLQRLLATLPYYFHFPQSPSIPNVNRDQRPADPSSFLFIGRRCRPSKPPLYTRFSIRNDIREP